MLKFLKYPTWAIAYKLPSFPEISALIAYKVIGYKKKIEYQFGTVTLAVPKMESALSTALGNLTSIWRPSHKFTLYGSEPSEGCVTPLWLICH